MSLPKPDGRPNFSQKTREEIKAEREAKKAAKAAAKTTKLNADKVDSVKSAAPVANCKAPVRDAKIDVATEKSNKVAETDNIKNKSVAANCELLEKNKKPDVATKTNTVSSQPSQEVLKENAIRSSSIVQNGASENARLGKLIFFSFIKLS